MRNVVMVSVIVLFLSAAEQIKPLDFPDLCKPGGQETAEYFKKVIHCMIYLDDDGREGEAKQCAPRLAGQPGKEADPKNCEKNNKIIAKAVKCGIGFKEVLANNTKFMDCFINIRHEPPRSSRNPIRIYKNHFK
ncbi:uncharacterized protein LOC141851296 [Brevipalpus obovatus]|uniref:uncharacterized protein LOC141851296 n=1 Tax=Brevipalpus obovatus TaxID=246614 RepID=UPI003D9EFD69